MATVLTLAACSQKELTDEDKARLPTLDEVRKVCASYEARDLDVAIINIPLMKKTTTVSAESRRCKPRLEIQLADMHSSVLASGSYGELSGAAMGLEIAGAEVKNMNAKREGLRGRYFNVYRKGKYAGLVYSSYDKSLSMLVTIFNLAEQTEDRAFELIRAVEERNLEPESTES